VNIESNAHCGRRHGAVFDYHGVLEEHRVPSCRAMDKYSNTNVGFLVYTLTRCSVVYCRPTRTLLLCDLLSPHCQYPFGDGGVPDCTAILQGRPHHLRTKMNWLYFKVKRPKVKVTAKPNSLLCRRLTDWRLAVEDCLVITHKAGSEYCQNCETRNLTCYYYNIFMYKFKFLHLAISRRNLSWIRAKQSIRENGVANGQVILACSVVLTNHGSRIMAARTSSTNWVCSGPPRGGNDTCKLHRWLQHTFWCLVLIVFLFIPSDRTDFMDYMPILRIYAVCRFLFQFCHFTCLRLTSCVRVCCFCRLSMHAKSSQVLILGIFIAARTAFRRCTVSSYHCTRYVSLHTKMPWKK